jgi:hypothetical protein
LLLFAAKFTGTVIVAGLVCVSPICGQSGRVTVPKPGPTQSSGKQPNADQNNDAAAKGKTKAVAQKALAVTQLSVEIQYYPGPSQAHIVVDRAEKHWIWFSRFERVPGWVSPSNSLPPSAVKINAQQAEEGVRVWVSVLSGKVQEEEKQISSYILREGDKVVAKELADVGVVPFELKIISLTGSVAYVPEFKSKSPAIELVSIQPNLSAVPTLNLVLRNVSSKPVQALEVLTVLDNVPGLMMMPEGKEGEALILPGGTYQLTMGLKNRSIPNASGFTIETPPGQIIEVATAMFADGSYEGNSDYALTFVGYVKGRKSQLARVIALLEAANDATGVKALQNDLSSLDLEADPQSVQELLRQFPQEQRIQHVQTAVQVGMRHIRAEAVKDISEFEIHSRFQEADAFNAWLTSARQRYKTWLARM